MAVVEPDRNGPDPVTRPPDALVPATPPFPGAHGSGEGAEDK